MPLFPSLNDLKGMTISINPLNLFDPKSSTAGPETSTTPSSPTTPRVGEAGPGPSSWSNRLLNSNGLASAHANANTNGSTTPSPLGNGAQRPRVPTKQNSSDSSTSGGDGLRGARPRLEGRRASSQVLIRADEPRRREKKKKVPMDSYVIVKPPPTSSKNPLNLQIQLVFKAPPGRRDRAESTATRSTSMFSVGPGSSVPSTPTAQIDGLPSVSLNSSTEMARQRSDSPQHISDKDRDGDDISVLSGSAQPTAGVRRRGSRKSSTSTVATTATAATGSTMGSAKRIQPMFNLSVHNVMTPTVVTDAGTDAKVAKFLKRHIDISDVGILEPAEIWLPTSSALVGSTSRDMSRPQSVYSIAGQPPYGAPISPVATRIEDRRSSLESGARRDIVVLPDGGAKKFFGKIGSTFKKRDKEKALVDGSPVALPAGLVGIPASPKVSATDDVASGRVSAHPTFGCSPAIVARRHSNPLISPEGAITGLSDDRIKLNTSAASIGIPQLQLQPSTRPVGYTWTVKRWAKSSTEGWAAHLVAAAAHGLELMNSLHSAGDDEVVFEWVKTKGPVPGTAHGRVGRERAATVAVPRSGTMMSGLLSTHSAASAPPSEPGDSPPERSGMSGMLRPQPSSRPSSRPASTRRASGISLSPHKGVNGGVDSTGSNSAHASPRLGPTGMPTPTLSPYIGPIPDDASATYHTADENDDSDPEDSETPWTCSVWVKRTEQRIFLATLTPAPHHPKVVGQLKIPMKLESVSLADLKVGNSNKGTGRTSHGTGNAEDKEKAREEIKSRVQQEVCISEESLKDVVCVTALWLVAREAWGGLGKRRKA